jgi:hypothetical protein
MMDVVVCTHLDQIRVSEPDEVAGCEDWLKFGGRWVHLRNCRSCGQVGWCDSSPNQHASKHAATAGHSIGSSLEPSEDWSWCNVDEVAFVWESDQLGRDR